tara:strand:- start:536 stop:1396 length:861 start_codon:yes stop_codon:yes gene_type:complete
MNRSNFVSNAITIIAISILACDKNQQITNPGDPSLEGTQATAEPQYTGTRAPGIHFDTINLESLGIQANSGDGYSSRAPVLGNAHYKIYTDPWSLRFRPETTDMRSEIALVPNGWGDVAGGELTILMVDAIEDPNNTAAVTFRAERLNGVGRAYVIQAVASGTQQLYPLWIDMRGGFPQFAFHTDGTNESLGTLILQDGSPGLPSMAFNGDRDTGLLRTGTNTVAVSAGGDVILDISPNGLNVYDWLSHRGDRLGFYGQWPTEKPTNVPVTIEGVHEALVSLGLIQ